MERISFLSGRLIFFVLCKKKKCCEKENVWKKFYLGKEMIYDEDWITNMNCGVEKKKVMIIGFKDLKIAEVVNKSNKVLGKGRSVKCRKSPFANMKSGRVAFPRYNL